MSASEIIGKLEELGLHGAVDLLRLTTNERDALNDYVKLKDRFIDGLLTETEALRKQLQSHRWNIEEDGNDLLICKNDHEKSESCEYVRYARVDK